MEDPVIAADGHSYEKEAIVKWFNMGKKVSPITCERLKHDFLTDNLTLKKAILSFK
jgi:hypothetical protein